MPERPEVLAAKEKLASLLPAALSTMEELLESPSQGARLGAAKDILDRGGVPVHTSVETHVEIGLNEQISLLFSKLADARRVAYEGTDGLLGEQKVELAEPTLFDELSLQPVPELVVAGNLDDEVVDGEIVPDAWWQATSEVG